MWGTRKMLMKLALATAAGLFGFCLVWFIIGRLTNPARALRVRSLAAGEGAPALQPGGELRIGIYNIAHGRGQVASVWDGGDAEARLKRLKDIARLLKDSRLDIVVLNEVDFHAPWSKGVNQAEVIAREAGFAHRVEQRNFDLSAPFYGVSWGHAMLSRFPIADAQLVDYPTFSKWENLLAGKKRGTLCTLHMAPGRSVRLLAVHLEHRDEATRVASARVIEDIRRQSDLPLIAAGDFNSTRVDFPRAITDENGQSAVSLLLEGSGFHSLPDRLPLPEELTFHTAHPSTVIDWIMVPPAWRIVSREAPAVELSDHHPVILTVVVD